jgi:SAM-dependent MidA family methyltransferase
VPSAADRPNAAPSRAVPIGFDAFVEQALYGTNGFYVAPAESDGGRGGGRAGRRGDFLTSPEVGPLFGAVVARFLDAEWDRLGRPAPFTFVDAGAGPGTLARSVLAAGPSCVDALRYVAVEVSEAQRGQHPDGVESVADLPPESFDGVVFANELLDNLPFRLAVFDGAWREAFVVAQPDGTYAEVLSAPFDPRPDVLPPTAVHGARAPLQDRASGWVARARSLVRVGTVVVVDYCSPTTAGLALRPWREWLRTYRRHERGEHPLRAPGSQDITCEVAIDQLPVPDAVRTQAQWLQRWGIDELVGEGRRVWEEQAARPGLEAMRMRSRISEAEALLDVAGLGGFSVLEWRA